MSGRLEALEGFYVQQSIGPVMFSMFQLSMCHIHKMYVSISEYLDVLGKIGEASLPSSLAEVQIGVTEE